MKTLLEKLKRDTKTLIGEGYYDDYGYYHSSQEYDYYDYDVYRDQEADDYDGYGGPTNQKLITDRTAEKFESVLKKHAKVYERVYIALGSEAPYTRATFNFYSIDDDGVLVVRIVLAKHDRADRNSDVLSKYGKLELQVDERDAKKIMSNMSGFVEALNTPDLTAIAHTMQNMFKLDRYNLDVMGKPSKKSRKYIDLIR